jgi:hypothetical protein
MKRRKFIALVGGTLLSVLNNCRDWPISLSNSNRHNYTPMRMSKAARQRSHFLQKSLKWVGDSSV